MFDGIIKFTGNKKFIYSRVAVEYPEVNQLNRLF